MNLHAYLSIEEAALYKQQKYIKERLGSMPDGRLSIVKNGRSSRWKHLYDKIPAEPVSPAALYERGSAGRAGDLRKMAEGLYGI